MRENRYGYLATMRARPGRRDEVIEILLTGQTGPRADGLDLYLVGITEDDPDLIRVQEVWSSKAHHDAALELPETRAAIATAMPMLTGEFSGEEITVVGGRWPEPR